MKEKLLDKITGELQFSNGFRVSRNSSPESLFLYFGTGSINIWDIENGWKHYTVHNVKVGDKYFCLTFSFENDLLQFVNFVLSDTIFESGPGTDWFEEIEELRLKDIYNSWLNEEIGYERKFEWGEMGAFYDPKGGFSSIGLNYLRR